jgi:hypothetical protein
MGFIPVSGLSLLVILRQFGGHRPVDIRLRTETIEKEKLMNSRMGECYELEGSGAAILSGEGKNFPDSENYLIVSEEFKAGVSIFSGSSEAAFMLSRNDRIPLPKPWPNSGSFFGPKMNNATTKTIRRWLGWRSPSIRGYLSGLCYH